LIIFICLLSLFTFCFVIYLLKKILKSNGSSFTLNTYDDSSSNEIIKPYIKAQNDFCENPNKYINQKYEDEITLFDVKLNDLKYQMYVFKSANVIIHGLNRTGSYEIEISTNITFNNQINIGKYSILKLKTLNKSNLFINAKYLFYNEKIFDLNLYINSFFFKSNDEKSIINNHIAISNDLSLIIIGGLENNSITIISNDTINNKLIPLNFNTNCLIISALFLV
jgi:hypothetical protein